MYLCELKESESAVARKQNIVFDSDENPDFLPIHLKGSSCVFPECVLRLGSLSPKENRKRREFFFRRDIFVIFSM